MNPTISLRPIRADDDAFLYRLYAGTREEELAPLGWDEALKASFLRMQFDAQHRYYQSQFPSADFLVILRDGQPAGRLYVAHRPDEVRVIDIALLPEHRGAGIGASLLRDLLAEADRAGRPVRLHVERSNRALGLYQRLGFRRVGDAGVYFLLERAPGTSPS